LRPAIHQPYFSTADVRRLEQRVPTFASALRDHHPRQVAEALDKENIYVWDGNYYALAASERLALEYIGGMVCVGPVHYNTLEEVYRFGEVLSRLATG
jgi:selenocysteine lyase/cysteine desulfurase